jgi:hypothetical protein
VDQEKVLAAIEALGAALRTEVADSIAAISKRCDAAIADALKKKKDTDEGSTLAEQTAADGRRADSVSRAEFQYVSDSLRQLQVSQPRKRTDADRNAFAEVQSRADVAHRALGGQADPPMAGEELADYVIRLHRPLLKHSKKWAKAELHVLARDPSTLNSILDQVRADAVAASMSPEGLAEFQHREVHSETRGGHKVVTFYGNGTFLKQLSRPRRFVSSISGAPEGRFPRSGGGAIRMAE